MLSSSDLAIVDGSCGSEAPSGLTGEGCTLCVTGDLISELPESTFPDELPALPFGEFDKFPAEKS